MFNLPAIPLLPSPRPKKHPAVIGFIIIFALACIILAASAALAFSYGRLYKNKILPGISVQNIALGGMTKDQAAQAVEQNVNHALAAGFSFTFQDKSIAIPATISTATAKDKKTAPAPVVRYQAQETMDRAFALGHEGSWWENGLIQAGLRLHGIGLDVPVTVDRDLIETALREKVEPLLATVQNAQLHVRMDKPGDPPVFGVDPERIGTSVNLKPAIDALEDEAHRWSFQPIALQVIPIHPEWTAADIEPLSGQVAPLLAHAPFHLQTDQRTLTITAPMLAEWLNIATSTQGLTVAIDPQRISAGLAPSLADEVIEAKDGELVMENDKIIKFVTPVDGVAFDAPGTIAAIESGWANGSSTIPITLTREQAVINGDDAKRLGIIQEIGTGQSNFSGSPSNRRRNIALGAKMVNGSLIAPDEEFSLLKVLGEIDGTHGWLPELVIKGNKTTPEFGGGLCQIGTTTFRAALASGLPITQRQNHSYRVRYYEPAGTDATIYVPQPDLKFKNDTGNWILLTTRIKGDEVAFTVWGTGDGRLVEQTKSKVYNIVPPPEKKIIESLDIPVGTTKCTEVAHAGADASFDYTVTYAAGETKKVTFASHYKPWGAVCLLGVSQLSVSSTTAQPSEKIDETGINNPN